MKTKVILGGLLVFSGMASAQWTNGAGSDIYKTLTAGSTGIGTTTPGKKLDVFTGGTDDGIRVVQTSQFAGGAWLNLTNNFGRNWGLVSSGPSNAIGGGHFALYDLTAGAVRYFVDGSNGNTGIGTIAPASKLEIKTGATDDGITIWQTSSGGAQLHLKNSTTGGHSYGVFSYGAGSSFTGGFGIYDYTAGAHRLFISGSSGNVGIGTVAPTNGRLEVRENNGSNLNKAIYSDARNTSWTTMNFTGETAGVIGIGGAPAHSTQFTQNYGVIGSAYEGEAVGGHFYGETHTPGIDATGVYGVAYSANGGASWAGYFNGGVYSSVGYTTSDRKLKDDINPLTNALDKIRLLKPRTYSFKTDEFNGMHLPKGLQMGLIAQELEEVFPELVAEVKAKTTKNEKGEIISDVVDHKCVNYTSLIPVLIAGIQEQEEKISTQQKQIEELKNIIEELKKQTVPTGIDENNPGSEGFNMSQNIPNPFNGETVVKYTLPSEVSKAYMAVYDLSGKQITSFPITEKGSSSITITSEKLAPGIYIYSIIADNKMIDSKRMIVAE